MDDLISRQAAIDSLHSKFADGFDSDRWWNSMSVLYAINKVPPVNPIKTGHCKDCKWWKDSDGTYCRGVHAESKCPINRKEVYEGNGYCYMFEPQESEKINCKSTKCENCINHNYCDYEPQERSDRE